MVYGGKACFPVRLLRQQLLGCSTSGIFPLSAFGHHLRIQEVVKPICTMCRVDGLQYAVAIQVDTDTIANSLEIVRVAEM